MSDVLAPYLFSESHIFKNTLACSGSPQKDQIKKFTESFM